MCVPINILCYQKRINQRGGSWGFPGGPKRTKLRFVLIVWIGLKLCWQPRTFNHLLNQKRTHVHICVSLYLKWSLNLPKNSFLKVTVAWTYNKLRTFFHFLDMSTAPVAGFLRVCFTVCSALNFNCLLIISCEIYFNKPDV